jgi:hypothetical protein
MFIATAVVCKSNAAKGRTMREFIHLTDGAIFMEEVNGKSFDEQEGFVLLTVECGSLLASLLESRGHSAG